MMIILLFLARNLLRNYNNQSIVIINLLDIISVLVFGSGMNGVEFLKHFSLFGGAS